MHCLLCMLTDLLLILVRLFAIGRGLSLDVRTIAAALLALELLLLVGSVRNVAAGGILLVARLALVELLVDPIACCQSSFSFVRARLWRRWCDLLSGHVLVVLCHGE